MKLICIADFKKNINGLWECYIGGENKLIENMLKKEGVEAYSYYEKELGSTLDIAEDLTSFSDEIIVLITDDLNYKLNIAIANKIKEEEAQCKVIFKIREGCNYEIHNIYDENVNFVRTFNELYSEVGEKFNYEDIYTIRQFEDSSELVKNAHLVEILLGITTSEILCRNIDTIKEDIEKLFCICDNFKSIKFSGIRIEQYKYMQELLDYLGGYQGKCEFIFDTIFDAKLPLYKNIKYNIYVTKAYIVENSYKLDLSYYKNSINKIILNISIFRDKKRAKNVISTILKNTENIEFYGKENVEMNTLEECIPQKYFECMNEEYQTLSRGILFSITGEYVSVPINGFVKHVKINMSDIDKDVIDFINEVCSVNSSILFEGIENESESNNAYIENLKKITCSTCKFENIEKLENEQKSYPLNCAYVDADTLNINEIVNDGDLKLKEISFSAYKRVQGENKDYKNMYIFTLDTEKDLQCLMEQVDEYYKTKQIYKSYLLDGKLKNMCRFMSRNYCSVTKIPRIAISNNKKIYPCYEMEEKIGDLSNSVYELTQEVYYKHQMRLKDSKCATCPANIACTKCIYMPEFLREKYCEIMINHPYITDFLIESMIVTNLSRTNQQVGKLRFNEIYISNEFIQNILEDEIQGEEIPYFTKYAFLIVTGEFFALWSPNTNKAFRVTKEIAVVCEALFKRLTYNEIIEITTKYNNMSEENATIFCEKVFKLLYENNMLHRQIIMK